MARNDSVPGLVVGGRAIESNCRSKVRVAKDRELGGARSIFSSLGGGVRRALAMLGSVSGRHVARCPEPVLRASGCPWRPPLAENALSSGGRRVAVPGRRLGGGSDLPLLAVSGMEFSRPAARSAEEPMCVVVPHMQATPGVRHTGPGRTAIRK